MRATAAALVLLCLSLRASACLDRVPREQVEAGYARAEESYRNKDVAGLIAQVEESNHVVKRRAALYLGRLGAKEALPVLRKADAGYARRSSVSLGVFAVAIALVENDSEDARRAALLRVARTGFSSRRDVEAYRRAELELEQRRSAESRKALDRLCEEALAALEADRVSPSGSRPRMDAAAEELLRFANDDVVKELSTIRSYGAKYTVLAYRCRRLDRDPAIARCVEILEAHETPQKAGAAERLLKEFGDAAREPVLALRKKIAPRIEKPPPPFTIDHTIVRRCDEILRETGAWKGTDAGPE